jgi:hypothetical protein
MTFIRFFPAFAIFVLFALFLSALGGAVFGGLAYPMEIERSPSTDFPGCGSG